MQQPNRINPSEIIQQAIQAKLDLYTARENYDAVMKTYNDRNANLVNLINLETSKILELEAVIKERDKRISELEARLKEFESGKKQDGVKKP